MPYPSLWDSYISGISQRELKVGYQGGRYRCINFIESHKENWKLPETASPLMAIFSSNLTKRIESDEEGRLIVGRDEDPNLTKRIESPSFFTWIVRIITAWISQRELKEKRRMKSGIRPTIEESHKENWKLYYYYTKGMTIENRISQRELKVLFRLVLPPP